MNKIQDQPLVTIVTSVLNADEYFERSILSIVNQTYQNIEYIIIDGASTDNTLALIKKYEDYISYWISENDNGIYDAWNKALLRASGCWITFLGADDYLYPHAIEAYIDFVRRNSECNYDFICSRARIVSKDYRELRVVGDAWDWRIFRRYMNVVHVASLHSRTLFERLGEFNSSEYKIVGDYELLLRSKGNLQCGFFDDITVEVRVGGVSDNFKVHHETYLAKVLTGGIPIHIAFYDKTIALIIFYLRRIMFLFKK